jgi:type IV secretory pathway ATPase VirB11/archaellum biosynthesis ATPase
VQRNLPLNLFLRTCNFSSTQSTTDNYFDALRACTDRFLDRLLHGTAERDALLELVCDATPDQICIQLWMANFDNL